MNVINLVKTVLACAAVLGLAGCGVSRDTDSNKPTPRPGTASSATPTEHVNKRGFVVTKLGEPACMFGTGDDCQGGVTYTIDSIDIDPACVPPGTPPEDAGSHTLLLHIRITTPDNTDVIGKAATIINPFYFAAVTKTGELRGAGFGKCTQPHGHTLPPSYEPNQQYTATMEVVVWEATGTLALQPDPINEDAPPGWEWTYPI